MTANAGLWIACENCGTAFNVKPSRHKRSPTRYCSRACRREGAADDFLQRIKIGSPDECWLWQGYAQRYGRTSFDGRVRLAHHIAFWLARGYWPKYLRHSCDVERCCNPNHLLEGTHQDNMSDKVLRERQARGEGTYQAKLTETDVIAIRVDARLHAEIAADYGVHPANISRIKSGKIWRHVP